MQKKIEWLKFTEEEKEERKKLKEDEEWRNNWTHKDFERYGGQYVAIRNKSVVAAAKTLEELDEKLNKLKVGRVLIEFIESPSVVLSFYS